MGKVQRVFLWIIQSSLFEMILKRDLTEDSLFQAVHEVLDDPSYVPLSSSLLISSLFQVFFLSQANLSSSTDSSVLSRRETSQVSLSIPHPTVTHSLYSQMDRVRNGQRSPRSPSRWGISDEYYSILQPRCDFCSLSCSYHLSLPAC